MAPTPIPKDPVAIIRECTIKISSQIRKNKTNRKAPQVVNYIKKFATEQMGVADVRIAPCLNKEIWKRGVKNVPYRVRVRLSRKRNHKKSAKGSLYILVSNVNVENFKELVTLTL